jgi:hypothetical protein
VTDHVLRRFFGWFPNYFLNKMLKIIPLSNTISYTLSYMVKVGVVKAGDDARIAGAFNGGVGEVLDTVSRLSDYQIGMSDSADYSNGMQSVIDPSGNSMGLGGFFTADFVLGFKKNLLYDEVQMGGNALVGVVIFGVLLLLGGIEPPDDEEKITTISEWKIKGLGVPLKFAWFMDDTLGAGLPLAMGALISLGYDKKDKDGNVTAHVDALSGEALGVAGSSFINSLCEFTQAVHVINMVDTVTHLDRNINDLFNLMMTDPAKYVREYYDEEAKGKSDAQLRQEWATTRLQCLAFDLFGDLTPGIAREVLPGSRDSVFGDEWQHTLRKEYDTEGRDLDTAKNEWRVKDVPYNVYELRRRTQDNPIFAFLMDVIDERSGGEHYSYQYQDMPIDTVGDLRNQAENSWENIFKIPLELDNGNPNMDLTGPDGHPDGKVDTKEERQEYLFDKAEFACQTIYDRYILTGGYPETAVVDGFYMPFEARLNAINYCYYMQRSLWDDFYSRKEEYGFLPQEEYQATEDEVNKYKTILHDYLQNEKIPWRAPRYGKLKSDTEVMYSTPEGKATNLFDPNAVRTVYSYGNPKSSFMPVSAPRDTGIYDYSSKTWDTLLDDDGNPINDMTKIYDQAAQAGIVTRGRWAGNNVLEQMAAGLGPHNTERQEELPLGRGDILTANDERGWIPLPGTFPEVLKDPDADTIAKVLGIDSYVTGQETSESSDTSSSSGGAKNTPTSWVSRGGGTSYSNRTYSNGGRSYSSYSGSNYNPKIYDTPRSVQSDKAQGLSVKTPYKATTTYLRPNFYTKGSREAYKRSDI